MVGKRKFLLNFDILPRIVALVIVLSTLTPLTWQSNGAGETSDNNQTQAPRCPVPAQKNSPSVKGAFAPLIRGAKLKADAAKPPVVTAKAAAVYLGDEDKFLFEQDLDALLSPASTTKIMTALVGLDNLDLSEVLTVPKSCALEEGNRAGLLAEEKLAVESLLFALLVPSGNDAACAFANSRTNFIDLMNKKAKALKLNSTHFNNAVGFDGNGSHYSSAADLAKLTYFALQNSVFRKIVGTREVTIYSVEGNHYHHLISTNDLLFSYPGTTGVKTGWTEEAGGCLVLSHLKGDEELITVVLGSIDRFADARALTEWAFENYEF